MERAMNDDASVDLLRRFCSGDDSAADEIFERYLDRLIALTRSRMSRNLTRRVDADDVVQSVYRSFFVRAREGRFQVERGGDLWRLMAAITINKLRKQVERHTARKRDMNQEQDAVINHQSSAFTPEALTREPTPIEAMTMVEMLEQMMGGLSELHRRMFEMRLQGCSHKQIATETCRSERTVRRLLEKIRIQLQQAALDEVV